jgi:hypothetical protein
LEKKIQEREAAAKAKVPTLPAILGKLKVARSKLDKLNVKYKGLQNQLKLCAEEGEAALDLLDELEAQQVTALDQQGYEPKQDPKEEEKEKPPPATFDELQKQSWQKTVQDHQERQNALANAANESLSKVLFEMQANYEAANKQKQEMQDEADAIQAVEAAKQADAAKAAEATAAAQKDEADQKRAADAAEVKVANEPADMDAEDDNSQSHDTKPTLAESRELFSKGGKGKEDIHMSQKEEEKRKGGVETSAKAKAKVARFEGQVSKD